MMKYVLYYLLIDRSRGLPWTNHRLFWGIEFPPVFYTYSRGEGRVFWCQPSLPSQASSVPALPNIGLLLYLCIHRRWEGRVLGGQPHHCVCTNASRRLLATADFLVFNWVQLITRKLLLTKCDSLKIFEHLISVN